MQQGLFRFSLPIEEVEEHFEHLFMHSVVIMDSSNRVIFCNSIFLDATGYSSKQVIGSHLFDFVEGVSEERENDPNMISGNRWSMPNLTVRSNTGEFMRSRYYSARMETENNNDRWMLQLYDIRPGSSLSLLQQFAGTLMRDINLGVVLFDTDFKLIDISDMACRVLGFARNDIVNKPIDEVFHFMPEEHRLVPKSIFDGIMIRNKALSWTNNTERYELLVDSSLLRDQNGCVAGGYVTFKDVTNIRSLEEQVQRSDRLAMIGQIAAGAAHEIRNPLTSVKGFLQMFRSTFLEKEMTKELSYADIMLIEIDRINELVNEFLLLSKRRNVSYDMVDVGPVLKEIMPIIHSEATLHGVSVQYEPVEVIPRIIADRELLKQVFLNIGKNGIEAMSDGGILTIQVRGDYQDGMLHIDIHDTGPGIPNFVVDKIFDPFFTTKASGTGLGLSVCQRIIHDMGGTIRVSCKGFGTTFTLSIPIP
ncbi:MAG: diguanylate cyclase [Paenibacillaceae bacterium]|jgi:PAS domain S-box-containing protein|nr:diguanylate cyclase [Paenibacillaceae bacterium]